MKIYISGKISGLPLKNVIEKFKWHKAYLENVGFTAISPIDISPYSEFKTWEDYMKDDLAALIECDAIYMLRCWGLSKGARVERAVANELGLKVIYEGEDLNNLLKEMI